MSVLFCAKCAPSKRGLSLPGMRSPRSCVTQAQEADAASLRPPCSERHGRPGPLSAAAPSWHACAVVKDRVRGQSDVSTAERAPHTDSSVESSKGLMYSNPSNSDWSILLMTSLWAQAEGTATGRPA